jgi:hypothetical protein
MSDGTGIAAIVDCARDCLDLADDLYAIDRLAWRIYRDLRDDYDLGLDLSAALARHRGALRRLHAMTGRLVGELGT